MGIVTTDTSVLTKLKGYWSGRDIYFNNSEFVVMLKPEMTASEAVGLTKQYIDSSLPVWIKRIITKVVQYQESKKTPVNSKLLFSSGLRFSLPESKIPKPEWYHSPSRSLAVEQVYNDLKKQGFSLDQITDEFTNIWLSEYRSTPHKGVTHYLSTDFGLLSIAWDRIQQRQIEDFMDGLWQLANADFCITRFGLPAGTAARSLQSGKIILAGLTDSERSLVDDYSVIPIKELSYSTIHKYFVRLNSGAEQALLYLVHKKVCLLPYKFKPSPRNVNAVELPMAFFGKNQFYEDFNAQQRFDIAPFLSSMNMESLADFPLDMGKHMKVRLGGSFATPFTKLLKGYALENGCQEYPYVDLKKKTTTDYRPFTPEWIKGNRNYSQEWYEFISMYWQLTGSGFASKCGNVRDLCCWAVEKRGFKTPYDIQPEDLRNPFMDSEGITFDEHLRGLDAADKYKQKQWTGAARIYTLVANAAKLPGSPLSGRKITNPFDGIDNPFSREEGGFKTKRPRMPDTIVETMVETLLEPDENGVPTYRWVQEATAKHDTATVPDPDDPSKVIDVWCPSTANCLATMLLTPIRGHQSRWLDQGLMDEYIFDLGTGQMVKNTHPLANWRYKNGKTQKQQYGRLSGVLQREYDSLSNIDEFIVWVSTNKTQMWSADKKRGYPLPWPTGEEMMRSEDEGIRAAGMWLNRAFQVLKYQIEWMQRYDPNPQPVGFEHSRIDRTRTNTDPAYLQKYPWFTPVFRNLAGPEKDERDGHQVNIHLPVAWSKLETLFGLLAAETAKRLKEKCGRTITLTRKAAGRGTLCIYNVHDLRVRGITHLMELGVPPHVVQYLVGHTSLAMTHGYTKFSTPWMKEQIINAVVKGMENCGGLDRAWQLIKDGKISPLELLVFPKHNGDTQVGKIAEDLNAYVQIAGGVCRMGGPGSSSCQVGRVYTRTLESGRNAGEEVEEYGSTNGACSLCRFWATGPLFLNEQEYAGNLTSFKLNGLIKRRRKLYNRRNELEITIDESQTGDSKFQLELERMRIDDEISNATVEITTTQLDLAIRAELFEESQKRMTRLRELLEENPEADVNHFELITGPIGENHDFNAEIIETGELGLVRLLLERFRFLQRKVVAVPEELSMRGAELTDQLLEIIDYHGGHLFQIRNHENRVAAASMLLNFFSYAADPVKGDSILQDVIDGKMCLDIIEPKKDGLRQFAALVIGGAKTEGCIDWEKMAVNGKDLFALSCAPHGDATKLEIIANNGSDLALPKAP